MERCVLFLTFKCSSITVCRWFDNTEGQIVVEEVPRTSSQCDPRVPFQFLWRALSADEWVLRFWMFSFIHAYLISTHRWNDAITRTCWPVRSELHRSNFISHHDNGSVRHGGGANGKHPVVLHAVLLPKARQPLHRRRPSKLQDASDIRPQANRHSSGPQTPRNSRLIL